MKTDWRDQIIELLPDSAVTRDEDLERYSTFRIGGPADLMVRPESAETVARVVDICREAGVALFVLGLGSNVLIPDEGIRGVVLRLGKEMSRVEQDGDIWRVEAGLPTPLLARRTARVGQAGVHRLVGVPGTVGGGVFMNAGAHRQDFAAVTQEVTVVQRDGSVSTIPGSGVPWSYRSSNLGDSIVVGACVQLKPADRRQLADEIREHFRWRRRETPFDQPCCGSVFKNPDRPVGELRTAGQIIDACGLKGRRIGDAMVSPVHANYIVNCAEATAADVVSLMKAVREEVSQVFEVELEPEVKVLDTAGNVKPI